MTTVGAFEAKTRFSQLLNRVQQGEEIVITRNGQAVAVLKPIAASCDEATANERLRELRELREKWNASTEGMTILELTHGGHKH